jgi:hypothetical protein
VMVVQAMSGGLNQVRTNSSQSKPSLYHSF